MISTLIINTTTNIVNTNHVQCHYCVPGVGTFYLSSLRKWACAECYTIHVITPRIHTAIPVHKELVYA